MSPLPELQSETTPKQENRFLDKLVILRGIGVFGIFALHFFGDVFHRDGYKWNGYWPDFSSAPNLIFHFCFPLTYGWTAVFLFLVISGFAIHHSYLQRTDFTVGHFLWRRWWRLYPPYLVVVAVFCILNNIDVTSREGGWQLLSHLLLIHNFDSSTFHGIVPTLWFVAAEFQLYLLFPLLLILRRRFGIRGVLWITLGLSLASRVVAIFLINLDDSDPKLAVWLFPSALWFDWTLGAYLAECYRKGERAFPVTNGQLAGLVALFIAMTLFLPTKAFSTQMVSFIFAIVIEKYLHASNRMTWIERAIIPIGWCSYSLYLWHEPLSYRILWKLQSWGFSTRDSIEITVGMAIVFVCVFAWSFFAFIIVERGSKWASVRLWGAWMSRRTTSLGTSSQ